MSIRIQGLALFFHSLIIQSCRGWRTLRPWLTHHDGRYSRPGVGHCKPSLEPARCHSEDLNRRLPSDDAAPAAARQGQAQGVDRVWRIQSDREEVLRPCRSGSLLVPRHSAGEALQLSLVPAGAGFNKSPAERENPRSGPRVRDADLEFGLLQRVRENLSRCKGIKVSMNRLPPFFSFSLFFFLLSFFLFSFLFPFWSFSSPKSSPVAYSNAPLPSQHKRCHLKQHRCTEPGCDLGFSTRRDLERHRASVHETTSTACPYCLKSFGRRADNLKRHIADFCHGRRRSERRQRASADPASESAPSN